MHEKLMKYFYGELTQSEIATLLEEVKADENLKKEFVIMQNTYALSQISDLSINKNEGHRAFTRFIAKQQKAQQKRLVLTLSKYAAIAILLITSTYFISQYTFNHFHDIELNTLYVPAGQRAKLTLEDGSTVWLNANSTLKYPSHFAKNKRLVEIEGEAFFDVALNEKKPFVVSTKKMDIEVLGTQFNVNSYSDTDVVKTELLNGSVKVQMKDNELNTVTLKPNEQVTIIENSMIVSEISNSEHFLWIEGIYSFDNERLLDIINKLQLYYDVKIVVEDPELFDVRYTGKFRQRDGIDEILRIIQKIRNFGVRKDTANNIITLTKEDNI